MIDSWKILHNLYTAGGRWIRQDDPDGASTASVTGTRFGRRAFSLDPENRFRFNVYQRGGETCFAFRRLANTVPALDELGLNDRLYELCDLTDGLVLVAGPTGSGKSTTIASLVDRIEPNPRVPYHNDRRPGRVRSSLPTGIGESTSGRNRCPVVQPGPAGCRASGSGCHPGWRVT